MDDREWRRAMQQLCAPTKGGVASADDDDALPDEIVGICDHIVNAAAIPRLGTDLREAPRRKRADPGGDHDRPRRKLIAVSDEEEMIVALVEPDDLVSEVDGLAEPPVLVDELVDEVLRQDRRNAGDVEDVLLGIERGQLPAGLGERVDDLCADLSHAGVEQAKESRGPGADDRDIANFVRHSINLLSSR